MKKTLFAILALSTAAAFAQGTPAEVKAQGKVDQETIKAHERVNKALNKEAQTNIEADAEADKKKLKAHQKTQKEVHEAASDVAKAQNKAEIKAAKEAR
ncbi:hypothetical protein RY831_19265 [Noviherbaspirillum sp. CPCC 100848]|uniref:Uncharacterized protein n=1 Tax=Noviherbaspirillum album TaxID=3080276 RepID=A0ABU6JCD2_9BURK|nr:hypothetical protein [Noviherbaspirillum sp. CPCC 100848]MEC4721310.1 hypothetical protein [Noviherbaspirillum sp. CPCC 100848]